jgi:nitrogen-specific signal transduction histidine kinase
VLSYEGFWLDVTRQTLAERRLATAAWKETISLLALGLSHDFNNVLAGISGLSESLICQMEPDHPSQEGLVLVRQKSRQAAQLIQKIAQLHDSKTGTRTYRNLNEVAQESVELLRTVVPRRLDLVVKLDATPLPLYVDGVELQQVLFQMALNAADAMHGQGQLTLRTSRHEAIAPLDCRVGSLPKPPAACLEVADTGTGIQPRLLPFLFDPFFTTKPMNRGSGLGLYNARLFAERHNGGISVQSQEGLGTTFALWLPLADFTEADQAWEQSRQRRRNLLLTAQPGKLCDDTAAFLRQQGYQVVAARSDAQDLLRSADYPLDGVLLLAEPGDPQPAAIARFVRQHKLPVAIIVKTVRCHADDLDPALLDQAHLIISPEMAQETILEKLAATLDLRSES